MNYREYGKGNRDMIILLHGGGLSRWNYREASEMLQDDFRGILPVRDGHAGSALRVLQALRHGEFLLNCADEYVKETLKIVRQG